MQRRTRNIWRLSVHLALVALALATVSCRGGVDNDRPFYLRSFPDSLVRYLASSDDSALSTCIGSIGFFEAREYFKPFRDGVAAWGAEEYRRHREGFLSIFKRYAEAVDREYRYGAFLHDYYLSASLSPKEMVALTDLRIRHRAFLREPRTKDPAHAARSREFLAEFERRGDLSSIGRCRQHLADLAGLIERGSKKELEWRRKALRAFIDSGESFMACQIMGEIASIHRGAGQSDSMRHYLDEMLRTAHRSRIPDHAGRALEFYAVHYRSLGRLGLAHELHGRAIDVCREYRGADHEIRFVAASMKFHADIGCWGVVARLAQREQALEKLYPESPIDTIFRLVARHQIARMRMTRGDTKQAERLYRNLEARLRNTRFDRQLRPPLLVHWGEGLIESGRPRKAVPVLKKCLAFSAGNDYELLVPRSEILLARAHLDLGDAERAALHLRRFEAAARSIASDTINNYLDRDILEARLASLGAEPAERELALSRSLARFVTALGRLDPTPHAYLWIHRAREYRRMLHEVAGRDAALGYGAELLWNDFGRFIGWNGGGSAAAGQAAEDAKRTIEALAAGNLTSLLRARADSARAIVSEAGAIHCLYGGAEDPAVRWTVSSRGILRETLPCPRSKLDRLVLEARSALTPQPDRSGREREDVPAAKLRHLARILLPESLLNGAAPEETPLLLVTADGELGAFPFEALDAGSGETYEPLLGRMDVAYLRHARRGRNAPAEPGIIFSSEGRSDLRGAAAPRLTAALRECRLLAILDPEAHVAENEAATKEALAARWESAGYIYIASHALRKPDAPYLTLIPLAPAPGGDAPERANLDFADARSADLSRCRLVVLSGCSTGAPYIDERAAGPAFGDAFLDGGAEAVIETFWDVGDEAAAAIMADFNRMWKRDGETPISALCGARRSAMRGPRGIRTPGSWAAYAIKLGAIEIGAARSVRPGPQETPSP